MFLAACPANSETKVPKAKTENPVAAAAREICGVKITEKVRE